MRKIFKHFFPLIISFTCAVIFFLVYNSYLLDKSLANLKISLKELNTATNFEEVREITALLNDSFLSDLTKGDFDLAFAVKMDVSKQLTDQVEKESQRQTANYVTRLSSASDIDFSAVISEKIAQETQISDIKHFVQEAIDKRISDRPLILTALDNIVVNLFPKRRKDNPNAVKDKIGKIKATLTKYKGKDLQEKYIDIGKLYLSIKHWNEAKEYFDKSLEIDSENNFGIKARFFLGILFKSKKDYRNAIAIFDALEGKLPKEWKSFVKYQKADCFYQIGEIKKAAALFEQLYNDDPSQEIPQLSQFRAAYTYLYDLKDPLRAQEAFRKLQKEHPTLRISAYISHKIDPDMAWQYCKDGFRLLEEGYRSSSVDKYEESLTKFEAASKIAHNYSVAYMGKALTFYFLGDKEKAIKEGITAQQADPSNDEVVANLGFIYFNAGMADKAIEQYIKAIRINPFSEIYQYNLGTLYIKKKEYNKAERYFRAAIKLNPKYSYAYNNLSYIFWSQGRLHEARENLRKAISLDKNYLDAQYNLGVIYYALGSYEEAQMEFNLTDKLQQNFKRTQWYLKQIENKLGYK